MTDQQAALGIVAAVVACLIWIVKFLMNEFSDAIKGVQASLDSHVEAANKIAVATDANTATSRQTEKTVKELQIFMKNLNGSLVKTVKTKQEEALK